MNCSHRSSSPMKSAGPLGAFSRSSLKSSKPYDPPLQCEAQVSDRSQSMLRHSCSHAQCRCVTADPVHNPTGGEMLGKQVMKQSLLTAGTDKRWSKAVTCEDKRLAPAADACGADQAGTRPAVGQARRQRRGLVAPREAAEVGRSLRTRTGQLE